MKTIAPPFFAGLLFSLGLGLAGMTKPSKVLAFLDLSGAWDPSLAFVMVGAIATYAVAFRLIKRRQAPLAEVKFFVPEVTSIDRRLLYGAALFGVGWGLGGYCPGPAVVSIVSGGNEVILFLAAMFAAMAIFEVMERSQRKGPLNAERSEIPSEESTL